MPWGRAYRLHPHASPFFPVMRPSPSLLARTLVAGVLLTTASVTLPAQDIPEKEVPKPNGTLNDNIESLRDLFELPNGQVLLLDGRGTKLWRGDFAARSVTATKLAAGPEENEVRSLGALWRWLGDSLAAVDLGKQRLTILTAAGEFARAQPLADPPADPAARRGTPMPLFTALLGTDVAYGQGIPPFQRPAGPTLPPPRTPYPVLRMSLASRAMDTIVRLLPPQQPRAQDINRNLATMTVFLANTPVQSVDSWGVLRDGTVVVARAATYKLDLIAPDGTRSQVGPVPVAPITVSDDDKAFIVAEYRRDAANRVRLAGAQLQGITVSYEEPRQWPAVHPPFRGGARMRVDAADRMWLETRCTKEVKATCYDVVDRTGVRLARFRFPAGIKLVGFGASSVYGVDTQKSDKAVVHRYPALF